MVLSTKKSKIYLYSPLSVQIKRFKLRNIVHSMVNVVLTQASMENMEPFYLPKKDINRVKYASIKYKLEC